MILADLGAEVVRAENPRDGAGRRLRRADPPRLQRLLRRLQPQQEEHRPEPAPRGGPRALPASCPAGRHHRRELPPRLHGPARVLVRRAAGINPRIILVSISAYGQDGPYATRPRSATSRSRLPATWPSAASPTSQVHHTGVSIADRLAGVHGAIGALARARRPVLRARAARRRLADGRRADDDRVPAGDVPDDGPAAAHRRGRPARGSSPNHVFDARDGLVLINAPEAGSVGAAARADGPERPRRRRAVRRPAQAAGRARRGSRSRSSSATGSQRSRSSEAYRALVAADVPAAPVRDIDQVAADPQVRHREMVVEVRIRHRPRDAAHG